MRKLFLQKQTDPLQEPQNALAQSKHGKKKKSQNARHTTHVFSEALPQEELSLPANVFLFSKTFSKYTH